MPADVTMHVPSEALRPPLSEVGAFGWLQRNLFSSWQNSVLTLVGLLLVWKLVSATLDWAVFSAIWTGEDGKACHRADAGACWPFVKAKFSQFMYGRYPIEQRWRVDLTGLLALVVLIPLLIPRMPGKRYFALAGIFCLPVAAFWLLSGSTDGARINWFDILIAGLLIGAGLMLVVTSLEVAASRLAAFAGALAIASAGAVALQWLMHGTVTGRNLLGGLPMAMFVGALVAIVANAMGLVTRQSRVLFAGLLLFALYVLGLRWLLCFSGVVTLPPVPTELWGGMLVSLVVASCGIAGSFPVGIMLALGRRSRMPVARWAAIGFIELVRGVPLITILFMASVMMPLFLPAGVKFDLLLRVLIAVMLFSGAYMAETIRGGLQAIPRGQTEAADALGLNYAQKMGLIVLPQALKLVIPGIVNSFVGLAKDTSLVLIIGMFDLLGIVQLNFTDPKWFAPNVPMTGYVFAAMIFWCMCFGISRYSAWLERHLAAGERK